MAELERQLFHDLGTIAAAERDALGNKVDEQRGDILHLTAERDALAYRVQVEHEKYLSVLEERDALQARIDRVRPWVSSDLVEILDGEYDGRIHTLDEFAKSPEP